MPEARAAVEESPAGERKKQSKNAPRRRTGAETNRDGVLRGGFAIIKKTQKAARPREFLFCRLNCVRRGKAAEESAAGGSAAF